MRRASLVSVLLTLSAGLADSPAAAGFAPAQSPVSAIFRIETDQFWLNLHHFLYVLGRSQSNAGDARREAVPTRRQRTELGLGRLTADERNTWKDAVSAYASGLSLKDAVREQPMLTVTAVLADADDAATLAGVALDEPLRQNARARGAPVPKSLVADVS
jgi:hypothetical protein